MVQGHVIELCNMNILFELTSSAKPTLEIAVTDAEGRERASTTVNYILVVRNDTHLRPAANTPGDEEPRDRKIEAGQVQGPRNRGGAIRYPSAELRPLAGGETPAPSVLLSPPALPDEALALQDGGPSEHSFHFKPVGDTLAQGVHRKFAAADGSRARSVSGTGGKVYYIIIGNNELKDMKLLFIILSLIIDHFLLL
jgi:hypothetical protein